MNNGILYAEALTERGSNGKYPKTTTLPYLELSNKHPFEEYHKVANSPIGSATWAFACPGLKPGKERKDSYLKPGELNSLNFAKKRTRYRKVPFFPKSEIELGHYTTTTSSTSKEPFPHQDFRIPIGETPIFFRDRIP
jgi:hypothetical protein